MRSNRTSKILIAKTLLNLILIFAFGATSVDKELNIKIVVSNDVSLKCISESQIIDIYTLKMQVWWDGKPIQAFALEDTTKEHAIFIKQYFNSFPYVITQMWEKVKSAGIYGRTPIVLKSSVDMYRVISNTVGGIGYIDEAFKGNLKVIDLCKG